MLPFSQPSCSLSYGVWDQRSITGGQHPGISGVAVPGIFFFLAHTRLSVRLCHAAS